MMIKPIFPVDGISKPWAQIFDELTNRWVLESVRDMELDAERTLSICHRVHSLHWAVKLRFHPMHQIPFCVPREEENTYKALGYLYVSALKLCEIVTQSELEASRCFSVLVVEGDIERPQIPLNKKNRAALALSMLSNENQELGDGRNPFSIEVSPGTHHLTNKAFEYYSHHSLKAEIR
jgi:hypothetical protein